MRAERRHRQLRRPPRSAPDEVCAGASTPPKRSPMCSAIASFRAMSPTRELLPKQEDLTDEFGVSKAAIREACRILETEGLLSVRRGNVGGAVGARADAHQRRLHAGRRAGLPRRRPRRRPFHDRRARTDVRRSVRRPRRPARHGAPGAAQRPTSASAQPRCRRRQRCGRHRARDWHEALVRRAGWRRWR